MESSFFDLKRTVQSLKNRDFTYRWFQPIVQTGQKHLSSIFQPGGQKWTKYLLFIIIFCNFKSLRKLSGLTFFNKFKLSFPHKAVILSLSELIIRSENFFLQKLFSLVWYLKVFQNKLELSSLSWGWVKLTLSWVEAGLGWS